MSNTVVAIGTNQLWSFSPAIDLLERFPPPPPSQLPQPAANAAATPATAAAPAPAASSSGKSGVSSALARLLLAAAAPPVAATGSSNDLSGRGALSMLLVDSGDILSALKTIIRSHAHRPPGATTDTPLDLYMLDGEPSATARHLLLLAIAFDTQLSLRGRTELFLEVYGNALIQEKTQLYLNRKVKEIRRWISTLQTLPGSPASAEGAALGAALFRSLVDLSHLKNKEIDALEAALDFVATPHTRRTLQAPGADANGTAASSAAGADAGVATAVAAVQADTKQSDASSGSSARALPQKDANAFDIETLRDHRLRGYFGDRYDARANLCDWDYHMRLKAVASIIHVIHYKKWRMSGVAFEERLCTYTYPNRSMASYRDAKSKTRGSVSVRGFWSDVLVSPYISLGVEARERRLFARKNRQHVKTSPHVCEYNLLSLLYELETGSAFQLPKKEKEKTASASASSSGGKKKLAPSKAQSKAESDADADAAPAAEDEEIMELPDEVPLPQMEGSAPLQASTVTGAVGDGSSAPVVLCHTTPNALSLAHCRLVFLNGSVQTLAAKSRYSCAFDRAYLSQFQVGCINESAAARAVHEAKENAAPADASAAAAALTNPAPPTPAPAAASSGPDSLPLNKLLRPGAIVTVEAVKFLPVTVEVKDAYCTRVAALASSAGWCPASPACATWSPGAFHSWTGREIEQAMEEEEKQQALKQPAHLFFKFDADAAKAK